MNMHPDDPSIMPSNIQGQIEDIIIEYMSNIKYDKARQESNSSSITEDLVDSIFNEIQSAMRYRCRNREHYDVVDRIFNLSRNIHYSIIMLNRSTSNKLTAYDYNNYINKIRYTLDELVKDSYEDEKRRLEVDFGLVDAISELLIVELLVFGVTPDQSTHSEAKSIRKFIANLLTNLVYGNAQMKRRLCNYSGFVEAVTTIIKDSPCLTTFYAALVRNLSWNADETTKAVLTGVIPVLTLAAVRAHNNNDQKCLIATLSALWNLGSHSELNKRAICDSVKFLQLVISLLDCSPANTLLVENASGVLKYACGHFIRDHVLLKKLHGFKLIKQLVILLNSSSFTVVASSLNVLAQLVSHDNESKEKLFKNSQAIMLIEKLRNSARQDIRNDARHIFDQFNIWRTPMYPTYSLPATARSQPPMYPYTSRIDPLYNPNYSMTGSYNQHSTLPQKNRYQIQQPCSARTAPLGEYTGLRSLSQPPEENVFLNDTDVTSEAGKGIPESLLGTRSGSIQSLTEEVSNLSWQSSNNTNVENSANISPVSESEIPDSPTEFAAQQVAKQGLINVPHDDDFYGTVEPSEEVLSKVINSALPKPTSSRQVPINQVTPHLPKTVRLSALPIHSMETKLELPRSPDCSSDIDFDDSIVEDLDNQPTPPMASASSSVASSSDVGSSTTTDGSRTTASKNGVSSTAETYHHLQAAWMTKNVAAVQPSRDIMQAMKESSLLHSPSTTEKIRDASCLYHPPQRNEDSDEDDGELSDDSYCETTPDVIPLEDLTAVPEDVDQAFLAEKLIIDCGSLNRSSRRSSSGIPKGITTPGSAQNVKIGLLSAATIKRLSKSRHPLPLVPPKTSRDNSKSPSARVPPYNYRVEGQRRTPNCPEKGQSPSTNKLLVTTV